jgi:acetyl/propionyl-CoA carboxylase alpha subunit
MKYFVRIGETDHEVELAADGVHIDGALVSAHVAEVQGTPVRVATIGDRVYKAVVRRGETKGSWVLWLDGHRFDVDALDERAKVIRDMSKRSAAAAGPAPLKAPMPGLIVRVNAQPGDRVQAGQGLVVMEAMKMENELKATSAGTVKAVHVAPGATVEKGALLIELE